jgi:hypothetical protein
MKIQRYSPIQGNHGNMRNDDLLFIEPIRIYIVFTFLITVNLILIT